MSDTKERLKQNGYVSNKNNDSIVDPFTNDVLKRLTVLQKIQIVLMTIFIAPFRLIFVFICLFMMWFMGHLILMFQTEQEKQVPVAGWKKTIGYPIAKFFSRGLFFFGGFHWITVKGKPEMRTPIMVFAPHSGFFDSLLVVYLNFVSVIGRAGADEIFIFGNLTKLCQPIIVDRDLQKSRTDSVKKVIDRVNSKLEWPPLSFYPEGTCTNRKELVFFKSGAFIPGLPVQPVCIKYKDNSMDTVSWTWEGPHPLTLCWLLLCQVHVPVEFHFLPVYYPNIEEIKDAELYAENVRNLMAKELNMKCSVLSYDDGRLRMVAKKNKLVFKLGDIKVQSLRKNYIVNTDTIFEKVDLFIKLADRSTGLCHLDSFALKLGLKLNEPVIRLFEIFDQEKTGSITLAQFVNNYFEIIHKLVNKNVLNERIQSFIKKLNKETYASSTEFIDELKSRTNIEILNIKNLFNLNDEQETDQITKSSLEQYLSKNSLFLYLITTTVETKV